MKVKDIFSVENDILIINKIEVYTIKEYKAILRRDKGSKGDIDGRKKFIAYKELLYMYMYHHPNSIYVGLPDEMRNEKCVAHCGFSETWIPDKAIKEACERFVKDLELSPLYYSYINTSRGVYGVGQDIAFFNSLRETLREKVELKTIALNGYIEGEEKVKAEIALNTAIDKMLDIGDKLIKMSNSLPVAFNTLETLKKKLAEEQGSKSAIYGGGDLGNREK